MTLLTLFRPHCNRPIAFVALLVVMALAPDCKRGTMATHEYMYVSVAETSLRDRVATMYNKVGTLHNGDRVEVLEKQKRFLRVRSSSGQEGWVEMRSLAPQDVFDGFQKLAQDNANTPVQAHGMTRAELNMHLTPSREGEHLYQLTDGEKLEILKRSTAEKSAPQASKPITATKANESGVQGEAPRTGKDQPTQPAAKMPNLQSSTAPPERSATSTVSGSTKAAKETEPSKPVMEDWYLVRNSSGHVGWVLLRMVDLDIPLEVAQYAEGKRIMAYFVVNTVQDHDKQVSQYLVCLNEPKDGLPWDFNQIRVFTWNRARHRYETAYRERNLEGYFPVSTGHRVFEKEGDLPTFTIQRKTDTGQMLEITYKLNGPIVRRVLTPDEEAAERARKEAALAARLKQRAKAHQAPTSSRKHHKKR